MSLDYLKKYLKDSDLEEGIKLFNQGVPVQYIVGEVDFYGNIFKVNKNVLIPRFETEGLVEETVKLLKNKDNLSVVDVGTGSGCIAITLKKLLNCEVDAVDISEEALEVAKENALLNNVSVNFIKSDLLTNLNKQYDCIISNPPYISYDEEIEDIVKNNEPHLALYALDNGLYCYYEIIKTAKNHLKKNGIIAFEIGYKQASDIKNMALKYFDCEVIIKKDLSNKDRYVFILT